MSCHYQSVILGHATKFTAYFGIKDRLLIALEVEQSSRAIGVTQRQNRFRMRCSKNSLPICTSVQRNTAAGFATNENLGVSLHCVLELFPRKQSISFTSQAISFSGIFCFIARSHKTFRHETIITARLQIVSACPELRILN